VKRWFSALIVLCCLAIGLIGAISSTPPKPKEPPITSNTAWITHPVLGVVFLFTVDGIRVQCAHAVFYSDFIPECRGLVGATMQCSRISFEQNYIALITDEPWPMVYGVSKEPSVCLMGGGNFQPATEKTHE